jgi:hypothetical protein
LKQTTANWSESITQAEMEISQKNPSFFELLSEENFKSEELKVNHIYLIVFFNCFVILFCLE